jgi:hypothetical protein
VSPNRAKQVAVGSTDNVCVLDNKNGLFRLNGTGSFERLPQGVCKFKIEQIGNLPLLSVVVVCWCLIYIQHQKQK